MKRCSRCVLPETYPRITFNQEGVCNYCLKYERTWSEEKRTNFAKSQFELEKIFTWAKRKKRKYDCLVPISGGKDSAYVLYLCKFRYKLNILAYHFDNGFVSRSAYNNLENITKNTGVDYVSFAPKWSLLKEMYRTCLLKTGNFCAPCTQGFISNAYRIADYEKIPLIIQGASPRTEGTIPPEINYMDARMLGSVLGHEFSKKELTNWMFHSLSKRIKRLALMKTIRSIWLPSFVEWDFKEMDKCIRSIGWGGSGIDHADCIMDPVHEHFFVKKWGFGLATQYCSVRIRDGQMTREEALSKIPVIESIDEPKIMDEFLARLELSRNEVEGALLKSHLDYESYLTILRRIKWLLRPLKALNIVQKEVADNL